jgi:hypothetical protein
VKFFEFTQTAIGWLHKGKLNSQCNFQGSVSQCLSQTVTNLFISFMHLYISEEGDIRSI